MDASLKKIADILRQKYGKRILQIVFFGSRARGDASLESDYDILLVFKNTTPALNRDLDRLAAEWLIESGIVFSYIALAKKDLAKFRYEPFLRNALKEGIAA